MLSYLVGYLFMAVVVGVVLVRDELPRRRIVLAGKWRKKGPCPGMVVQWEQAHAEAMARGDWVRVDELRRMRSDVMRGELN